MADRPVLGIDLGTMNSCGAHLDEYGNPSALQNGDSDLTTPSVVYFEECGDIVVGKDAQSALRLHPDRVVQHVERRMGVSDFFVELDGCKFYPPQISAKILESVVTDALVVLGLDRPMSARSPMS